MNSYGPSEGLHVTILTPQEADCWTRRVYNVPDHVGLGWKPYTVIVQSYGATAHTAFHSLADFRAWLGGRYKLRLSGPWQSRGIRSGRLVAA